MTRWIEITKQKKHQKKDPPFQRPKSKGWGTQEEKDEFKIGSSILACATRLGHVRLDTTQIYTHVSIRALKQVHTTTHPAARLNPESDQARKLEITSEHQAEIETSQNRKEPQVDEAD